jgi:hypothetical protein
MVVVEQPSEGAPTKHEVDDPKERSKQPCGNDFAFERASSDETLAIVRGKLTPLERARIMTHLIGDFWSRVDEGQNRRHS